MKKLALAMALAFSALALTACNLTDAQKEAAVCQKNPKAPGCPTVIDAE